MKMRAQATPLEDTPLLSISPEKETSKGNQDDSTRNTGGKNVGVANRRFTQIPRKVFRVLYQHTRPWWLCSVVMLLFTLTTLIPMIDEDVQDIATDIRTETNLASPNESMSQNIWYIHHHHHRHAHHKLDVNGTPICNDGPCYQPPLREDNSIVRSDRPGFPSYFNYATGRDPISVTFDKRSLLLNGERALFIGGSMHPIRATPATWEEALDQAVDGGLNLVTIYIMWSAHQPTALSPIDWNLSPQPLLVSSKNPWDLANAIRSASSRGLFVHIRIGPYVCAEYNYGGIPEWVPLSSDKMSMRRPNAAWMKAMEDFVTATVAYLKSNRLFAYQGGPIIMAQIENELGGDVDPSSEYLLQIDSNGTFINKEGGPAPQIMSINMTQQNRRMLSHHHKHREQKAAKLRNATLQDYADWCGQLADNLAPEVVWTMCNGYSAENTIDTYNGFFHDTHWLEENGDSGRIQEDHPAMWTEHEGGFQIWGDQPDSPSDYVWGFTARSMAYCTLRWFARGGSHINYYMFWGGYNRERSAAAGITNMYESDAPLCPSGEPRQPKFDHFQELADLLADIAPVLLSADSALNKETNVYTRDRKGYWEKGKNQRKFVYQGNDKQDSREIVFVENAEDSIVTVKVPLRHWTLREGREKTFQMQPFSAVVILDGDIVFDSSSISSKSKSYKRKFDDSPVRLTDWVSIPEPIGVDSEDLLTQLTGTPVEQTILNLQSLKISGDYAWFETNFEVQRSVDSATLFITSQQSNAFIVYLDGKYIGNAETHFHKEESVVLNLTAGPINKGYHSISFLSESLGYSNLIGRWGASTKAKLKGITGQVTLDLSSGNIISLTDGREWRSFPGLHLHRNASMTRSNIIEAADALESHSCNKTLCPTWSTALFSTPTIYYHDKNETDKALYLEITGGRGHLWLNGKDLGRFWNVTRGESDKYSQRYYFLPDDYLFADGTENEIVIFDSFGSDHKNNLNLVLSWIQPSSSNRFEDEVGFPLACL